MGKKYGRAIVGLLVVGGVGYVGWHMKTHDGKLPWVEKLRKTVVLPAGTKVELILLEGLVAGSGEVGDNVDMAVVKDVTIDGALVVRRGDKAKGEITETEGSSIVGAFAGKKARLAVSVSEILLADGRRVKVGFGTGKEHVFTQANTADRSGAPDIEELWTNPETRKSLENLARNINTGRHLEDSQAETAALVRTLGLKKTAEATAKSEKGQGLTVGKVFDAVTTGRLTTLAGVDAVAAAESVGEVAALAASVDNKVRGTLMGKSLRATIGTTLTVKTLEPIEQVVWMGPGNKPLLSR